MSKCKCVIAAVMKFEVVHFERDVFSRIKFAVFYTRRACGHGKGDFGQEWLWVQKDWVSSLGAERLRILGWWWIRCMAVADGCCVY